MDDATVTHRLSAGRQPGASRPARTFAARRSGIRSVGLMASTQIEESFIFPLSNWGRLMSGSAMVGRSVRYDSWRHFTFSNLRSLRTLTSSSDPQRRKGFFLRQTLSCVVDVSIYARIWKGDVSHWWSGVAKFDEGKL